MVVYCEKCNSKFQVDDAKIPEAGIKARCSVCSHGFLLKKETSASSPAVPVSQSAPAATVPEKARAAGTGEFDAAIFGEPDTGKSPMTSFATANSDTFFSRNTADSEARPAKQTASQDIVVEIAESGNFDEVEDIYEEQGEDNINDVFSAGKATSGHASYDSAADRQVKIETPVESKFQPTAQIPATDKSKADAEVSRFGSNSGKEDQFSSFSEPVVQKAGAETATTTSMRFPEVVSSAGAQLPSNQIMGKAEREILHLLDQRGMTDDYVVQMVQEVCNAVKYVEGVEKPDWPTRMMGLEMLCKIKGLYAGEKKEDPSSRQVQIVTGINM